MASPIHTMGSPATADERSALLPGAGEITRPVRGCVGDIVRNRWFRVAMVAKSAFFTLGTVVLLAHGGSISTVLYPRDGNGYLEVPAEAHHAPLWRGDPLVNHPAAPQLNVAWFPVHRGRFVVDQVAERAEDAKKKHDDRMPKWPKHVIGGDHWHDLGVVAMSGAFGGAREKQPEFWYKSVPGDVPVVSMDVRGHGESERGWNALGVDDAFASMRWNLMANDVLAVADDAKFRKVILVGSSMTNAVALWATVSEHTKARVAGVLMVRPATGWEIRGEGICKLRKIAWTHASFAMLLRRARRFAEGVEPRNLDDDDLAPLPPPELTSLIGKSELYSRKSHASRWVLSGNKWRKYMGNPGLGSSATSDLGSSTNANDVYKSTNAVDPGLNGYWSDMVERYLSSAPHGDAYVNAAKRYAASEPEEWRRISPLVPLRYLGDKVSDYPSRRALQLWFASPAGKDTPVKVVAYNWSRTHRYVMAKALRFLTGGDWSREYFDGTDGLSRTVATFVEKVRRRESGDEKTDFWKDDEEAEERIAGVTRDEDWVKSDYVDSVDYDDGNDEDEAGTAASSLGRKKTRHMHGLMKEMDALLGAEGADDMDAEAASVPPQVFAEEAARLVKADADRVTARGRSLDDWLVENFGEKKSLTRLDLLDYCDGRCCRLKTQLPESGWVPEKSGAGTMQWVFHDELASEESKCYAREQAAAAEEERREKSGGVLTRDERFDKEADEFCVSVIKTRMKELKSAAEESRQLLAAAASGAAREGRRERRHRRD